MLEIGISRITVKCKVRWSMRPCKGSGGASICFVVDLRFACGRSFIDIADYVWDIHLRQFGAGLVAVGGVKGRRCCVFLSTRKSRRREVEL
jgi:hypothetical protein